MSDSDDSEFGELFDAFDDVDVENLETTEVANKNLEAHGSRIDPYGLDLTPFEKDQATLANLKSNYKRTAETSPAENPAKKVKRSCRVHQMNKEPASEPQKQPRKFSKQKLTTSGLTGGFCCLSLIDNKFQIDNILKDCRNFENLKFHPEKRPYWVHLSSFWDPTSKF